jgi:hypothetical protein
MTSRRILTALLLIVAGARAEFAREAGAGEELLYAVPPLVPQSSGSDGAVADGATYWIASSRRAAQHRLDPRTGTLDFFRRNPDGTLTCGDAFTMQSEIVSGVPVCIFIHGSFVQWSDQLNSARTSYHWIRNAAPDQPLQVIFFDWPSDGPYTYLFPVDVTVRGERAEFNGFHLAYVISLLPPDCPVCLIGHSHGARTVASALHLSGSGAVQGLAFYGDVGQTRPIRAVMAAAAFDHDWLNPDQLYGRALCRSEVMNLRNNCDAALHFYPLARPLSRPALANVGFTELDREAMGMLAYRAIELDVTELVGRSHTWPYYEAKPAIASAIAPFVYFMDLPSVKSGPALPAAE